MIDLKRNLFKIDVRAQKDEEKVFMRTACLIFKELVLFPKKCAKIKIV
ncbi:exfoliative toxin [Streptococcus dysgalactiae]|uniref:Exfoliative toxin n=1 Tax=Streptococcus dysgalactiae subsp. dysgalactiae TaxID=99822 RepID=A0A9X7X8P8_STRDY|nr:exfoliative toxin [Streptococcus dysgalactiae]QGH01756.1 exfoliative toxin [Streptococcus dysgalactiae subsp. dysgalactiae]